MFLHLFNRNSLDGIFRFEKKNHFFILLLFLLCNRNSLVRLVNFFRFEKKNHFFIFVSTFKVIYVTEIHQLDLNIFSDLKKKIPFFIFLFFLFLCNRNSLAGLVHFFSFFFYIHETLTHQLDLYIFSDLKKKFIFSFLFLHLKSFM